MKRFTFSILGAVLLLFTAVACGEKPTTNQDEPDWNDIIWDVASWCVSMEVTDAAGNNLFESGTSGNWLGGPIVATYNSKEYSYPSNNQVETKELLVQITGLRVRKREMIDHSFVMRIEFGDFNGDDTLSGEINFAWPDGTSDVVSFNHTCKYVDHEPKPKTSFSLNGEPVSGIIKLTKTPLAFPE